MIHIHTTLFNQTLICFRVKKNKPLPTITEDQLKRSRKILFQISIVSDVWIPTTHILREIILSRLSKNVLLLDFIQHCTILIKLCIHMGQICVVMSEINPHFKNFREINLQCNSLIRIILTIFLQKIVGENISNFHTGINACCMLY